MNKTNAASRKLAVNVVPNRTDESRLSALMQYAAHSPDHLGNQETTINVPVSLCDCEWMILARRAAANRTSIGEEISQVLRGNNDEEYQGLLSHESMREFKASEAFKAIAA